MISRSEKVREIFDALDANPDLMPSQIVEQFGVKRGTATSMRHRWKKARGYQTGSRHHYCRILTPAPPAPLPTLEDILKVATVEQLGQIVLTGFMDALESRDKLIEQERQDHEVKTGELIKQVGELEAEKKRIIDHFNTELAKAKVGHVTVDQVQHRLIPSG